MCYILANLCPQMRGHLWLLLRRLSQQSPTMPAEVFESICRRYRRYYYWINPFAGALIFYSSAAIDRGQLKAFQEKLSIVAKLLLMHPPEMTVDGVTYVPVTNQRAATAQQKFLPPYQHYASEVETEVAGHDFVA